jgi:lysine 2,3-aminomutase
MRIDNELCSMLSKYHPLWMNIHFNHPKEITPEVQQALARLANAGIPLGSQTVLLAGINDCPQVMKKLLHTLVQHRVRPYYMYQCDLVPGTSHFRTPVGTGMHIMENLRGHTSGFAVPTYVIDAPQGGGKVPIAPQYMISQSDQSVVVRNYEGLITAYAQPESYPSHNPAFCPACRKADKADQKGVAALLSGEKQSIIPQDWHSSHQRSVPLPENLQARVRLTKNGKGIAVKLQSPAVVRVNPPKSKRR